MENYPDRLELLYMKYPSDLYLQYGHLIVEVLRGHIDKDIIQRRTSLDVHIEKLRSLYETYKHTHTFTRIRIAELLMEALAISIRLSSEDRTLDYIIKSIKEIRHLYEKHDNDTIREYVGLALIIAYDLSSAMVHDSRERSNVQILFKEFMHIRDIYTQIHVEDSVFFSTGAILKDYEVYRREDGLFVIVVNDRDLSSIDPNDEWIIEKDRSIDDHIVLAIGDSSDKLLRLIIYPVR